MLVQSRESSALHGHLDESLAYWRSMYLHTEQRAARLSTVSGAFAAVLATYLVKQVDDHPVAVWWSPYGVAVVLALLGVAALGIAGFLAITILLPATSSGVPGLRPLAKHERAEDVALTAVRTVDAVRLPAAMAEHADQILWAKRKSDDTDDSFALRSRIVALLHFRRMCSVRARRATRAIYFIAIGLLFVMGGLIVGVLALARTPASPTQAAVAAKDRAPTAVAPAPAASRSATTPPPAP